MGLGLSHILWKNKSHVWNHQPDVLASWAMGQNQGPPKKTTAVWFFACGCVNGKKTCWWLPHLTIANWFRWLFDGDSHHGLHPDWTCKLKHHAITKHQAYIPSWNPSIQVSCMSVNLTISNNFVCQNLQRTSTIINLLNGSASQPASWGHSQDGSDAAAPAGSSNAQAAQGPILKFWKQAEAKQGLTTFDKGRLRGGPWFQLVMIFWKKRAGLMLNDDSTWFRWLKAKSLPRLILHDNWPGLLSKRFCSRKRPNGQTRGLNSFHNSFWGSRLSCLVRRKMLLHDSWWHLLCCQVIEEHHASGWPFHLPPSLHWTRWDCRDYLGKIRWSKTQCWNKLKPW